jgi:hypothetical protein
MTDDGWRCDGASTGLLSVQVSVLTIDTTATPLAPAEPFGVAEWKWLMVES